MTSLFGFCQGESKIFQDAFGPPHMADRTLRQPATQATLVPCPGRSSGPGGGTSPLPSPVGWQSRGGRGCPFRFANFDDPAKLRDAEEPVGAMHDQWQSEAFRPRPRMFAGISPCQKLAGWRCAISYPCSSRRDAGYVTESLLPHTWKQRLIVGKDVLGKAGDRVVLSDEGKQWCQQHYPDWYSDCVGTITRVAPPPTSPSAPPPRKQQGSKA